MESRHPQNNANFADYEAIISYINNVYDDSAQGSGSLVGIVEKVSKDNSIAADVKFESPHNIFPLLIKMVRDAKVNSTKLALFTKAIIDYVKEHFETIPSTLWSGLASEFCAATLRRKLTHVPGDKDLFLVILDMINLCQDADNTQKMANLVKNNLDEETFRNYERHRLEQNYCQAIANYDLLNMLVILKKMEETLGGEETYKIANNHIELLKEDFDILLENSIAFMDDDVFINRKYKLQTNIAAEQLDALETKIANLIALLHYLAPSEQLFIQLHVCIVNYFDKILDLLYKYSVSGNVAHKSPLFLHLIVMLGKLAEIEACCKTTKFVLSLLTPEGSLYSVKYLQCIVEDFILQEKLVVNADIHFQNLTDLEVLRQLSHVGVSSYSNYLTYPGTSKENKLLAPPSCLVVLQIIAIDSQVSPLVDPPSSESRKILVLHTLHLLEFALKNLQNEPVGKQKECFSFFLKLLAQFGAAKFETAKERHVILPEHILILINDTLKANKKNIKSLRPTSGDQNEMTAWRAELKSVVDYLKGQSKLIYNLIPDELGGFTFELGIISIDFLCYCRNPLLKTQLPNSRMEQSVELFINLRSTLEEVLKKLTSEANSNKSYVDKYISRLTEWIRFLKKHNQMITLKNLINDLDSAIALQLYHHVSNGTMVKFVDTLMSLTEMDVKTTQKIIIIVMNYLKRVSSNVSLSKEEKREEKQLQFPLETISIDKENYDFYQKMADFILNFIDEQDVSLIPNKQGFSFTGLDLSRLLTLFFHLGCYFKKQKGMEELALQYFHFVSFLWGSKAIGAYQHLVEPMVKEANLLLLTKAKSSGFSYHQKAIFLKTAIDNHENASQFAEATEVKCKLQYLRLEEVELLLNSNQYVQANKIIELIKDDATDDKDIYDHKPELKDLVYQIEEKLTKAIATKVFTNSTESILAVTQNEPGQRKESTKTPTISSKKETTFPAQRKQSPLSSSTTPVPAIVEVEVQKELPPLVSPKDEVLPNPAKYQNANYWIIIKDHESIKRKGEVFSLFQSTLQKDNLTITKGRSRGEGICILTGGLPKRDKHEDEQVEIRPDKFSETDYRLFGTKKEKVLLKNKNGEDHLFNIVEIDRLRRSPLH